MQDRPPRYDVQPEKPPSYEECFAEPNSSPPPYTVAIGIGETSSHISSRRPPPYYMSDLVPPANLLTTPLNVQSVRLMEEPSTDDLPSPVQNMEDFAALTESESACSLPYDSLHSDSQTIVNSQESSEQQDDSLALFSWNSCTEVASESSDSFNVSFVNWSLDKKQYVFFLICFICLLPFTLKDFCIMNAIFYVISRLKITKQLNCYFIPTTDRLTP